ncbi:hypothetical protein KAR91_09730 [Candidatus Pacearchaeota archaeon]|nr:hypothetical protein [Candidatus Pacearchaeota archaeon]
MIWINFGKWTGSSGKFFSSARILRKGFIWTPFIRVKKRYDSWLGYWGCGAMFSKPDWEAGEPFLHEGYLMVVTRDALSRVTEISCFDGQVTKTVKLLDEFWDDPGKDMMPEVMDLLVGAEERIEHKHYMLHLEEIDGSPRY